MLMVQAGPGTDAIHPSPSSTLGQRWYLDRWSEILSIKIPSVVVKNWRTQESTYWYWYSGGEKQPLKVLQSCLWAKKGDLVADVLEEISAKAPGRWKTMWSSVLMLVTTWKMGPRMHGDIIDRRKLWPHATLAGSSQKTWLNYWMEQGWIGQLLDEITGDILKRKDVEGQDGTHQTTSLDAAGNKGTGKWTSQSALTLVYHCHHHWVGICSLHLA